MTRPRTLAAMGGAYGNLGALAACLDDAERCGAQQSAFLGDAIGCCGHSEQVVAMIAAAQWTEPFERARALGLITPAEISEVRGLLDPAFPWFQAVRGADSVHVHIKVEDTEALPLAALVGRIGGRVENARSGYVKLAYPGGINLIFSSIPVAEEHQLTEHPRPPRPFVDHLGIDLRRELGAVRAVFDDTPELARLDDIAGG